jgi:hypothetical protein
LSKSFCNDEWYATAQSWAYSMQRSCGDFLPSHGSAPNTFSWAYVDSPQGYEGLLVDNYQALLAVLSR